MKSVCKRLQETRRKATARSHRSDLARLSAWNRKYYYANQERRIANALRWQKENPGKAANKTAVRQRLVARATPLWAEHEWIEFLYEECADMSRREVRGKFHVDHVVPVNSELVCGLHVQDNLRIVPAKVNLAKSNRTWPDMP